jgi:phytoene dehydrogenase-like protein
MAPAGKHSDTMLTFSRRSFLAASAALVAAPTLGAMAATAEVDVVIIGAGAAGIAAARRVAAANRRFALIEAGSSVGGRCVTDTKIFGVPYDLGAHWIHNPDSNPVAKLATGLDVYPAPRAQTLRVGPRPARDSELEGFLAANVRSHRALADAGKGKADMPASKVLPRDLGDWQSTIEFILGPFGTSQDLAQVSAFDLARAVERDSDAFCRQGYGALLAKLAAGLPVQLGAPVDAVYWGKNLAVDTPRS